jgi:hypothetical protein
MIILQKQKHQSYFYLIIRDIEANFKKIKDENKDLRKSNYDHFNTIKDFQNQKEKKEEQNSLIDFLKKEKKEREEEREKEKKEREEEWEKEKKEREEREKEKKEREEERKILYQKIDSIQIDLNEYIISNSYVLISKFLKNLNFEEELSKDEYKNFSTDEKKEFENFLIKDISIDKRNENSHPNFSTCEIKNSVYYLEKFNKINGKNLEIIKILTQ